MALTFGVSTSHGYTGPIQNFETVIEGERAEARDANGDVQAVQAYNPQEAISFDWILDSGDSPPAYGATLTIGATKYYVETATKTEVNTDYIRYAITARRWTANTIPAA